MVETGELTIDLGAQMVGATATRCTRAPPSGASSSTWCATVAGSSPGGRCWREVWGSAPRKDTSYLRVYLAQLRRKLEPDPAHPEHLITEAGRGYRFRG